MTTPKRLDQEMRARKMQEQVNKCWNLDIDWSLYPKSFEEACEQLGLAYDVPKTAVLSGLLLLVSYRLSHCTVSVPGTSWHEPVLLWIIISMPTGSGKTPLFSFLDELVSRVRVALKLDKNDAAWCLDEASFEMMGYLMAKNDSKLLGLYDEFSTFLSQINVYRGKGLCESHDLATLLSLFNAKSWNRDTVSGDANFHMDKTGLSLGGFTQPSVATSLIELPQSQEKGLVQRFLWILPTPTYGDFKTLQVADESFCEYLTQRLMKTRSTGDKAVIKFEIPEECKKFENIYDDLQRKLSKVSLLTNELLAGLLSKAKGLILRVAACIHVLVSDYKGNETQKNFKPTVKEIPTTISEASITAAENFVNTCCQHCVFLSGGGLIENEIRRCSESSFEEEKVKDNASFTLTQPGKVLDLSAMLRSKKYAGRDNKEGAVKAMTLLESDGLGKLEKKEVHRGASAVYKFVKASVPTDGDELVSFTEALAKYGMSLIEYKASLNEEASSSKRKSSSSGLSGGTPTKVPRNVQ